MIYAIVILGMFLLLTGVAFALPIVSALGRLIQRSIFGWFKYYFAAGERIAARLDGEL